MVVVNHALLLSDLTHGGSLIPDYKYLVIDEAHNLEDEATRQLGFEIGPERLEEITELVARYVTQLRLALASESLQSAVRQEGDRAVSDAEAFIPIVRELWARLWSAAAPVFDERRQDRSDERAQLLLDHEVRGRQPWSNFSLEWENLDVRLTQAVQALSRVQRYLESTTLPGAADQPALVMEAANLQDSLEAPRNELASILGAQDGGTIHWMAREQDSGEISLHAAPLDVGATLKETLFDHKESVVMTSATLSTDGNFDYFRSRSGLPDDSDELLVGSPFDYPKAALLLIPDDMPPPNAEGYPDALAQVLINLTRSLGGHTMALFTSHSSLRGTANRVRTPLTGDGIQVLAQGVDGPPQQLISRFADNPKSLLLGASSFWEGVDLPGGVLKALVLARLPFQVPTDPVVKTRSEQYEDPFKDYSIPQAVLRFRQGIGRLIRNKGDKGAIVVLDRRVTGRSLRRVLPEVHTAVHAEAQQHSHGGSTGGPVEHGRPWS